MGRAAQDQRKTAKQKRQSAFKRATGGNSFSALRKDLVLSGEFKALSGNAVKVLNVLMVLYNGSNNGDLSAPLLRNTAKHYSAFPKYTVRINADTLAQARAQIAPFFVVLGVVYA